MNLTSVHEDVGLIPGLALRVEHLVLLRAVMWLQMWHGSGVAVAVV